MRKTILIFLSLAVWGMAGQAAEVKPTTDINPQSAEVQTESAEEFEYNLDTARKYMQQGDWNTAFEYLNVHLKNDTKSCDGYFLRALIHQDKKDYPNALLDFNNAIKYWKKDLSIKESAIYWLRADVYKSIEMYDKAEADFTKAYKSALKIKDYTIAYDILFDRAEHYYSIGNYDKSDADFKFMLKENEFDLSAMIGLARNMIERGEYKQAIELINKCEKLNTSYSEIYRFRMQAYDKLGETTKAINDMMLYIQTAENIADDKLYNIIDKNLEYSLSAVKQKFAETNNAYYKHLLVYIYRTKHDYVNAIVEYNKMEKDYGPSQSLYYYRGFCYNEIGDVDKAIEDMTKCFEMGEGKDYYSIVTRADFYRGVGKYDEAITDFKLASELEPLDVYPYYKLGWCYELKGDDKTAMEYYNKGIAIDQDYPYIFLMRGEQYLKHGEVELANADFNEVLAKDTLVTKGSCRHFALLLLDKHAEALEWMNKMVELDPNDAGAYYDKACLLSRMGKLDEAIATLRISFEKGYRAFAHIEHDDDMDAIRNHPDFISLIDEYKQKPILVP